MIHNHLLAQMIARLVLVALLLSTAYCEPEQKTTLEKVQNELKGLLMKIQGMLGTPSLGSIQCTLFSY